MADLHPHYGDSDVINVETKHEESDVNVRGLLVFVVVFIVFAIVTHVGLYLLFKVFIAVGKGETANAPLSAVAAPPNSNVPDLPRLQPFPTKIPNSTTNAPYTNTPETDMLEMRARQDGALANYSWVDKDHGVVRIPIEEAKKIALTNGTYKSAAATATPQPTTPATQQPSNSATPNP